MAEPKKRTRAVRRRRRKAEGSGVMPLLMIGILVMLPLQWQVSILVTLFMVPTFVLAMTSKGGTLANDKLMTVALMNLAGVLPFAVEVWETPAMFQYVLVDAVKIATMFGAAAMGYMLIWICPYIAATILDAMATDRLKKIADERKVLQDLFGAALFDDDKKADPKGM